MAIMPMFFKQIEKFQCLKLSSAQKTRGTCHVSINVS